MIDDRTHARGLHARPGAAEEFGIRMPRAQGLDHARRVQVARRFTG